MPVAMAPASASVVVPPSLPSTKSPKSPGGENRSSPDEDKGLSGSEGGSPIVIGDRKEPVEPLPPQNKLQWLPPDTAGTPGAFKTSQSYTSLQAIEEMEGC
jgi:hypothetical protein